MASGSLKTSLAVQSKCEAFYTGGKVQFSGSGNYMICQCGNKVKILEVNSGKTEQTIGSEEDDLVTSFVLSPDEKSLVIASRNLQLKQWDWKENVCTRTWRAIHVAPISCMSYDCTSTLLATGGSDSTIKVWDTHQKYCTHNLTGHQGVVSIAEFHPNIEELQLFSAADDYKIRVWDLRNSTCIVMLESHYSVITALQFSANHHTLYSAARDNVITVWSLVNYNKIKTIPVYEAVEGMVLLPEGRDLPQLGVDPSKPHFLTAGAKGTLKIWNVETSQCVFSRQYNKENEENIQEKASESEQAIVSATYNAVMDSINLVTFDHHIMLCCAEDLSLNKQFVGYNDDILDIAFLGKDDSHIAVATNSDQIKIFELQSWACQILSGHTATVMCLSSSADKTLLASGSKDNSVRIWKFEEEDKLVRCVALAPGHTHAILATAFSRRDNSWLATGSQDCTLKVWSLPNSYDKTVQTLHSSYVVRAHDKDINAISVSPNDKIIATGSMDKTAKLWKTEGLKLLGVLRGHKRGIWDIQFSPVDQVVATASADSNVHLWSVQDFTCVKTLEGHESSVLKLRFISRGMQIISSGSDGLLKLWTVKNNECIKTYDAHDEKVWALAVNENEDMFVSGAGDSTIILWKDVSQTEEEEQQQKMMDTVLKEQKLSNLLQEKKYLKAIALAITLDQPFKVLNILKEVISDEDGKEKMKKTLCKLREDQLDSVLKYAVQWNTNSKHCHAAQYVLSVVLKTFTPEELYKLPNIRSTVAGLLPYTERHLERMNRLQQSSTFVDYTWYTMKPLGFERPEDEMDINDDDVEIHKARKSEDLDSESNDSSCSDSEQHPLRKKETGPNKLINETSSGEESSDEEEEIMDIDKIKEVTDDKDKLKDVNSSEQSSDEDESDEAPIDKKVVSKNSNKKQKGKDSDKENSSLALIKAKGTLNNDKSICTPTLKKQKLFKETEVSSSVKSEPRKGRMSRRSVSKDLNSSASKRRKSMSR